MRAYFNGHTIRRHRYHGDCWYTVDDQAQRFQSNASAVAWITQRFGSRRPLLASIGTGVTMRPLTLQ